MPNLRDDGAFGGFVAQIARRAAVDFFRSRRQTDELPVDLAAESVGNEAWLVLQAIRRLPDAYKDTLAMRFVEGLTGPEIAHLTGLTHDSVRVNLHRGVKLLREQLKGGR